MVLLHSGVSEETGRTVIGYVVREKGQFFIVMKDGNREVVRLETVMPYKAFHSIEDYVNLPGSVVEEFHSRGVYYLEDLAQWKEEEFDKIKGIGRSRKDGILKIIQNMTGSI